MNAKVINKDKTEEDCTIIRKGNKLIIKFSKGYSIYRTLRNAEFTVKILPTDDEIECDDNCYNCLTPIC